MDQEKNNQTMEPETTGTEPTAQKVDAAPKKKKRRWHFGDRSDGYKLRTIPVLTKFTPYIMPQRCDACNTYADMFEVSKVDKFCREKVKAGMTNFSFLHVLLAAYVRIVSQRPGVNRFVSGQKIYARKDIQVVMVVKKQLTLEAPDTVVKVRFEPTDTIDEVYRKFDALVTAIREAPEKKSDFDKVNKIVAAIPGLLCRWTVKFLNFLDYFGLLPKKLLWISPFHGSMIVTSMGSLGIRPIYHHIYNFGNLPVFLAYGGRRSVVTLDREGNATTKKYIEMKAVTDERICDGFYYASSFRLFKRYVENPELLETPPEQVYDDIL